MLKATITSLAIRKRLLHLELMGENEIPIQLVYRKKDQAKLKPLLDDLMKTPDGKSVSRVGHVFSWQWVGGLLFPTTYIGQLETVSQSPLWVDQNSPSLRSYIPQAWFTVTRLWLQRGGGDVQFYTYDARLVAIEHKSITDLLSSMSTRELDDNGHKQSKMTRQLRQILEADIAYLVIEGRNWKRDAEGHICTTEDYKKWYQSGWKTSSLDAFKRSWMEAGIRVVETQNIEHTVEFVLSCWRQWNKPKHPYVAELLKRRSQ